MGNGKRDITINASDLLGTGKRPVTNQAKPKQKAPVKKAAVGDAPVARQARKPDAQDKALAKKDGSSKPKKKKNPKATAFACTMFSLLAALLGILGVASTFGFPPVSLVFGIAGIFAALASKKRIGRFDRNPQWVPGMAFSVIAIVMAVMMVPGWVSKMQDEGQPASDSGYENMIDGMSTDAKDVSDKFGGFWNKFVEPILPD